MITKLPIVHPEAGYYIAYLIHNCGIYVGKINTSASISYSSFQQILSQTRTKQVLARRLFVSCTDHHSLLSIIHLLTHISYTATMCGEIIVYQC